MAGLRTAEALRSNGFTGEVLVLGDERWAPYNRPPLSKEALQRGVEHAAVAFRMRASVTDVEWRLGTPVTAVDLHERQVTLDDGSVLGYDAVVAATGVSARRLHLTSPAPLASAGRHVVRTLDDALALRAELVPGARVVVIGAGFIGCEVAATARLLGCEVDCVAVDSHPMVRPLGVELAAELQRRHEAQGVRFHLGTGVKGLTGEEHVRGAVLTDGTELPADVVVEALGSRCNVDWLEGHGLELSDGVLVDSALRPVVVDAAAERVGPLDGVAVVGDIARFPNPRFDDAAWRVEHWSIPTDTGRRAGAVLAAWLRGEGYRDVVEQDWQVLPAFWSDQYDLRIQSYGMPVLADVDGVRVLEGDLSGDCVVGYLRGDELVGVVGIGMLREVNAYRSRVGRVAQVATA
jgi:NADPH-dependent 2,4-dienoyl-CoA reductase/sulfur reductase-like enzyme